MFVQERFKLDSSVVADIERKHPPTFGFGGFGSIVYNTNYSRRKADGSQERWVDTCTRVVEGVFSIRKNWYKNHGLKWDNTFWDKEASELMYYIYTLKLLPPGRSLWAQGTDYVYNRGSMALNNCAASKIEDESFAEDLGWVMDSLMCGTGVGVSICISEYFKTTKLRQPYVDNLEKVFYEIPDSREGWVMSVVKLLNSFRTNSVIEFSYDKIRKLGSLIKGFGGTSSGPKPLIELHTRIQQYMTDYINSKYDTTRTFADIVCAIGACVVAGNIRRSAEILLGNVNDDTFINLKNYKLNPDREDIGWMSNNTVCLENSRDFLKIDSLVDLIATNGEPGLLNKVNLQKYERYGKIGRPDKADIPNPCCIKGTPVISKTRGVVKIEDIKIGESIWSKEGWTKVLNFFAKGKKDVYKYSTNAGDIYLTPEHRVVYKDTKVEVKNASELETLKGSVNITTRINSQDTMDGLVMGDGTNLKGCQSRYLFIGGKDHDYFSSEVSELVHNCVDTKRGQYKVTSTLLRSELALTYERCIPDRFVYAKSSKIASFLRGLFSANGDALLTSKNGKNTCRVSLKASSLKLCKQVQIMLSSLGIKSYSTTDKAKFVTFSNGTYICKESYKVNIVSDINVFNKRIGFLQLYKNLIVENILNLKRRKGTSKLAYKIYAVDFACNDEVFDITVDNSSHTFWAAGFDISNCSELGLENKELCNLVEVFPSKMKSKKEFKRVLELATLYAISVSLLPTHSEETNAIIARNRRIGVSLSGISDWFDTWGACKIVSFMRAGYDHVRETAKFYNDQAGVPTPIRVTTVKPSGTVSLLAGVSAGMHFPIHEYAIRRMRICETHPMLDILRRANIPIYDDVYSKGNTRVIEYPIYTGGTRPASKVSAWEQFALLALLQREWSDNMVSCTITFNEAEKKDIGRMLSHFIPLIKSVSLLPVKKDEVYPQMPYEGISEAEYNKRVNDMKDINWSKFEGSDGKEERFCSNDTCSI